MQSFSKTLVNPLVEAVAHAEANGFPLFRPFLNWTASSTQGQKNRFISLTRLANKAAMLNSIILLNLFQGLTCNPDREPKLTYTVTSFDAIGKVSQSSLGGRGLTYFFLPTSYRFLFSAIDGK